MSTYKYSPLPPEKDAVRLLTMNEYRQSDGHLSCSLTTTSFNDGLDGYIAVSHVWGGEEPTLKILLDGQSFFVSPYLWRFLHAAAERIPGRKLWIDAICIDQQNLADQERQIPMMGLIYSKAQKLIAWLPSYSDWHKPTGSTDQNLNAPIKVANERLSVSDLLDTGPETRLAMLRLIFHEYWSRVWIVQELRLSKHKEFWWEGQIISSKRLENIITTIAFATQGDLSKIRDLLWKDVAGFGKSRTASTDVASLCDHMEVKTEDGFRIFAHTDLSYDLAEIVLKHSKYRWTVREDRVYALLGLVGHGHRIHVKYNINPADLLIQIFGASPEMNFKTFRSVGELLGVNWGGEVIVSRNTKLWEEQLQEILLSIYEVSPESVRNLFFQYLEPNDPIFSSNPDSAQAPSNFSSPRAEDAEASESCAKMFWPTRICYKGSNFIFFPPLGIGYSIRPTNHDHEYPVAAANLEIVEVVFKVIWKKGAEGNTYEIRYSGYTDVDTAVFGLVSNLLGNNMERLPKFSPSRNDGLQTVFEALAPEYLFTLLQISNDAHPFWGGRQCFTVPKRLPWQRFGFGAPGSRLPVRYRSVGV